MAPMMRDYKVIKKLGAGSFGTVVLVEKGGKQYCMKKVDCRRMPQKERQAAKDEAKILNRLDHLDRLDHLNHLDRLRMR